MPLLSSDEVKKVNVNAADATVPVDLSSDSANVANRKKIVYVDASSDTTVTAGSSETITVQPPDGKIWRIKNFQYNIPNPAGATSGSHTVRIYNMTMLWAYSNHMGNYDQVITFISRSVLSGSLTRPSSESEFAKYLYENLVLNYDNPLYILYNNSTDADQTNERKIYLILEEEDEAE